MPCSPPAPAVKNIENVIEVCFGLPEESDLPQIGDADAVMDDLIHQCTGKPRDIIGLERHNRLDLSFSRWDN